MLSESVGIIRLGCHRYIVGVLDTDRRILVLGIARMADAIANSFLIIILPLYIASGGVSVSGLIGGTLFGIPITLELLIGIVLSLFGFLNSFAQPVTGRLSDRTGRRRYFILLGLVILAVSGAAYIVVDTYLGLVVVRALQGIGGAFVIPATIALVNDLAASASERGSNFGVFNTFRLLGFGVGPIVAGQVVELGPYTLPGGPTVDGFTAAFGVAVAGAAVSFLLVWAFIADPEGTEASAGDDLSIAILDRGGPHRFDPIFILGVGTFFMATGIALFATLQEPINARLGQGPTVFGLQFAITVVVNVIVQVPVGRGTDIYGRRPFLLLGFILLIPAVVAQGLVSTPAGMLAARGVHGISVAMVFVSSLAVAGDLAVEGQSGTTLSVLTMAFGLGTAVGPLLSGVLVAYGFIVPFLVAGVLGLIALVLTYTEVEETLSDPTPVSETAGSS